MRDATDKDLEAKYAPKRCLIIKHTAQESVAKQHSPSPVVLFQPFVLPLKRLLPFRKPRSQPFLRGS